MPSHGSQPTGSVGTETDTPVPNRVVKAAAGVKKFLTDRLTRLSSIFLKDRPDSEHQVYLTETDEKHADSWKKKKMDVGFDITRSHVETPSL